MHFQIAGKHFFRAPNCCEPVFLTLNRYNNLFLYSKSCELHFLVSKQQGSTFFSLQIAATEFVRLEIARNQFFHFQIAGKHLFRAPTGCEPVFLTLNKCHNVFPCHNSCELHFLVTKQQESTLFSLQIYATVFVRLEIARNQFFALPNSWETSLS